MSIPKTKLDLGAPISKKQMKMVIDTIERSMQMLQEQKPEGYEDLVKRSTKVANSFKKKLDKKNKKPEQGQ